MPTEAFQVTALFVVVPATVGVKASLPFVSKVAEPGDIPTDVTAAPVGGAVISIVAVADFVGSATLVAVTAAVPALAGAL